jgi:hypothetical protein
LEVKKLKREDILICIFPIYFLPHPIIYLENPTCTLIYGQREYVQLSHDMKFSACVPFHSLFTRTFDRDYSAVSLICELNYSLVSPLSL